MKKCTLPHTHEVWDADFDPNTPLYKGNDPIRAARVLRRLAHSKDFMSGAFVFSTHASGEYCRAAVRDVERRC